MAGLSHLSQPQTPDLSIPRFFARLQDPRRAHRRLHRLRERGLIADSPRVLIRDQRAAR